MINVDECEGQVEWVERVVVDTGATVSVCPLGYALEIPIVDGARNASLRTSSGAQIEHAAQKTFQYEHGGGGSVNVNFEVADVTRQLVAVGDLQKRGMTVVMGLHGSFVTRGQVAKPPGNSLTLEHSSGAHWTRVARGENGTKVLAQIELRSSVPMTSVASELLYVEDTIDIARESAEAQVLTGVAVPKEPNAAERSRHELTHMPFRSWCFSSVAGRGTDDPHRKSEGHTGPPRIECDFLFLLSPVHLTNPTMTMFQTLDREPGDSIVTSFCPQIWRMLTGELFGPRARVRNLLRCVRPTRNLETPGSGSAATMAGPWTARQGADGRAGPGHVCARAGACPHPAGQHGPARANEDWSAGCHDLHLTSRCSACWLALVTGSVATHVVCGPLGSNSLRTKTDRRR